MKNYLIIGNGIAGNTAASNIRKQDDSGNITIITDDYFPFYYRIRLNDFIAGGLTETKLVVKNEQWYAENRIAIRLGTRIAAADPEEKIVFTETGEKFPYDYLLVAAGSHPFIPPVKGAAKEGVFTLHTIQHARAILNYAEKINNVVLIGGGLLGIETGNALRKLGKKVTIVEFFPRLLPRQLDVDGAARLQGIMEVMGLSFKLGAKTREIKGAGHVESVALEGGETINADMVIISAGVRPNLELAKLLGLEYDKGIKVDDHLRTNQPAVFAAGDVTEFNGMSYGIWPAGLEQGKIAGINMAGGDTAYQGTTMANILKVAGIDLASAGEIDTDNAFEARITANKDIYKKIVIKDNRIIGCILLGDTSGFQQLTKAISEKKDVSQLEIP